MAMAGIIEKQDNKSTNRQINKPTSPTSISNILTGFENTSVMNFKLMMLKMTDEDWRLDVSDSLYGTSIEFAALNLGCAHQKKKFANL